MIPEVLGTPDREVLQMKFKWFRIFCFLLLLVLFGNAPRLFAQEEPFKLTLQDAVRMAMEKNLDVKTELFNPAIAEADWRGARGIYNPNLSLLADFQNSATQPTSLLVQGGSQVNRSKQAQINPGVSQLIPLGGTIGLSFDNTWNTNNAQIVGFLNRYWNSDLALTFTQPLLKNFGSTATDLNIIVASYQREGSLESFRGKLMDTIASVRQEYFNLYRLREDLKVQETSLKLAQKILEDTKARVKAGILPAMEILSAEFGVAQREQGLNTAELAVRDQVDRLRLLLQLPENTEIVTVDTPSREYFKTEVDKEILRALAMRPELLALKVDQKSLEVQARVARNRTLPDLSLNSSLALTGLDQNYDRDLSNLSSANYPVWSVGLQFDYPLGNDTARNEAIRSRLQVGQNRTQIQNLQDTIGNEVRSAVRAIETSYKQIDVTDRGLAFARERLQAFIKRNSVGLATTKDVLDVENDLVTAQNNQIAALVDYTNAITQLWRSTGEILQREGIAFNEKEAENLYRSYRNGDF
jgi:outer membrane protein